MRIVWPGKERGESRSRVYPRLLGLPALPSAFLSALFAALVLAASGSAEDCSSVVGAEAPGRSGERASASFLAVGDFGKPPGWIPFLDPRRSVSDAMSVAHRCRPADGLILLGDNFYPNGLDEMNFERRVRDTVVRPFCRFLSLSGQHGPELAADCPLASADRIPVPIVAVMGNHDYEWPVDGRLEKEVLATWIPEWRMPQGVARVFEMPGGVSLIAIDSVRLHEGAAFTELSEALEASRGPWRILVAHHPLTQGPESWQRRYVHEISKRVALSGKVVHVMLSGHEHALATSRMEQPGLPLQVVAGSGARVRAPLHDLMGKTRVWLESGFVRIDVFDPDRGDGGDEGGGTREAELRITLLATASRPAAFWQPTRPQVRLGVTKQGRVFEIAP